MSDLNGKPNLDVLDKAGVPDSYYKDMWLALKMSMEPAKFLTGALEVLSGNLPSRVILEGVEAGMNAIENGALDTWAEESPGETQKSEKPDDMGDPHFDDEDLFGHSW